jgi:hypothetical protein
MSNSINTKIKELIKKIEYAEQTNEVPEKQYNIMIDNLNQLKKKQNESDKATH